MVHMPSYAEGLVCWLVHRRTFACAMAVVLLTLQKLTGWRCPIRQEPVARENAGKRLSTLKQS